MTPPHQGRRTGDCCVELDTLKGTVKTIEDKAERVLLEGCAHRVESERRVNVLEGAVAEIFKMMREAAEKDSAFREEVLREFAGARKDFQTAIHGKERDLGRTALRYIFLALLAVLGYLWAKIIDPVLFRPADERAAVATSARRQQPIPARPIEGP